MSEDVLPLLQGKFPELRKMKREELQQEVQMWRKVKGQLGESSPPVFNRCSSPVRHLGLDTQHQWEEHSLDNLLIIQTILDYEKRLQSLEKRLQSLENRETE